MHIALALALIAPLSACGGRKVKPAPAPAPVAGTVAPLASGDDPCAIVHQHDERWYTPGGLYAPQIADGDPSVALDVSTLAEPVPQAEAPARYGNRSPYSVLGKDYEVLDGRRAAAYREQGIASWYGTKFHGRKTSSLEPYDMCQFSAAHKTLPLPSYALVTNLENGRDVIVRVNDRGPFHDGRVIDLSYAAALKIGVHARGTARVEVQAIDPGDRRWQRFLAERSAQAQRAVAAAEARAGKPAAAVPPAPVAAHPAPAVVSAAGATPPVRVEALPEPPPRPVVPAPAAPAPGTVPSAARWLQVGSFSERGNADAAVARLRSAGLDAVDVAPVDVAGRAFWRVRVGPLATEAVGDAVQRVMALGLGQPRLATD
nr:septal ring lytic transglycosylase RlpA family protein [Coralloluteibacterium stylophorae]